jgi:hypothetical protein
MTKPVSLESARAAKKHAARVIASRVGEEVAVGITGSADAGYSLKINLTTAPRRGVELPDEVDGVPVKVEVVGKIRKR